MLVRPFFFSSSPTEGRDLIGFSQNPDVKVCSTSGGGQVLQYNQVEVE